MRNIDAIIQNLNLLKEQYEKHKDDEEYIWWEDEYGSSLVWEIECHPVFSDGTPCLNDTRGVKYQERGWNRNCSECKARWLMEIYE
ncbi:MAG: hypothetical protein PHD70_14490 [Anaerostipes sp.]|nr:hypothetical protein [Anaerostipes sp.]